MANHPFSQASLVLPDLSVQVAFRSSVVESSHSDRLCSGCYQALVHKVAATPLLSTPPDFGLATPRIGRWLSLPVPYLKPVVSPVSS